MVLIPKENYVSTTTKTGYTVPQNGYIKLFIYSYQYMLETLYINEIDVLKFHAFQSQTGITYLIPVFQGDVIRFDNGNVVDMYFIPLHK